MRVCEVCAKRTMYGNNVSHSNRKSNRSWSVNVQKVHDFPVGNGKTVTGYVCTRCLRTARKVAK
ncbi:MAG: 50S ribosomal protein L28 [Christensenellaceae bacterium]|jgi:large subunit ribosomal protein L28|nr:50S ribosomal protein L28 [Christensenellaceae bacterium]